MMNYATQAKLNDAAAELLRLADVLREAGDMEGALAASDAGDYLMVLLDMDSLRTRAEA